jgi:chromosome segregation ATPase
VSRLKSQGDLVDKELKKYKEDLRGAHAEITRLQSENVQLGDTLSKARENLSSANELHNETTSHINKLETELDNVKVHRDKLSFELQQTQSNLKLIASDSERPY